MFQNENKPYSQAFIAKQKQIILSAPSIIAASTKDLYSQNLHVQMKAIEKLIRVHSEVNCAQSSLVLVEKRNKLKVFQEGSRIHFAENRLPPVTKAVRTPTQEDIDALEIDSMEEALEIYDNTVKT